ncbi:MULTISPECIES: hypothetical protein [Bacillaceae]|uniref:Uncharacterized protein n=2 Tax=Cytobacillus TaxID=2675230 RepID=W7KS40_CYTFI|nr:MULTISPECIES: hypothetical protein [Bacillaceae]EWG08963.1 hypothetical protein PBF_21558 [Cytobacillus firmus DS1]MBN8203870.1 hypothetical protein [Bacillus sp. NTK034]
MDYHSNLLQIEKPLLEFTHLFRIEMEKDNSISDVIVRSFKSKEDANNIMNQMVFTLEKFVENQKQNYMKLTDENREVRNRSQILGANKMKFNLNISRDTLYTTLTVMCLLLILIFVGRALINTMNNMSKDISHETTKKEALVADYLKAETSELILERKSFSSSDYQVIYDGKEYLVRFEGEEITKFVSVD